MSDLMTGRPIAVSRLEKDPGLHSAQGAEMPFSELFMKNNIASVRRNTTKKGFLCREKWNELLFIRKSLFQSGFLANCMYGDTEIGNIRFS